MASVYGSERKVMLDKAKPEASGPKRRSKAQIEARITELEAKKGSGDRSPMRRQGQLEALRWALGEDGVL
jgi:hypothetical protein